MVNTVERAYELSQKHSTTLFKLCQANDINYSTITTARKRGNQLNIQTIDHICNAMGITISEFFIEPTMEKK